ncbi:monovalent cation/H(+) antiporter subunit G [bacterium]|nr:monovalent cation/H(+) antiporter subunit G [bacterium]
MTEILVSGLVLAGSFLTVIAGLGLLRMPDLFLRMSATSKAATLGMGLIMLGAAIYFNEFAIYTRLLATIVFIFLTVPVGAHMIGRAAYFDGTPLWEGTVRDDLKGHYRVSNHALDSNAVPPDDTAEVSVTEGDDFPEEN